LETPINTDRSEYYPTLTDDGTMYFGSRREGGKGGSDLYSSRLENGKYVKVQNLSALNTQGNEFEPFIARDESFVIFMMTPTESLDDGDFYVSFNNQGKWTEPKKLPAPFNSDRTEFSPKITMDSKYFFFSSNRNRYVQDFKKPETTGDMIKRIRGSGNGLADIYQVDFSSLKKVLDDLN
jgi:hypothetical protein